MASSKSLRPASWHRRACAYRHAYRNPRASPSAVRGPNNPSSKNSVPSRVFVPLNPLAKRLVEGDPIKPPRIRPLLLETIQKIGRARQRRVAGTERNRLARLQPPPAKRRRHPEPIERLETFPAPYSFSRTGPVPVSPFSIHSTVVAVSGPRLSNPCV